MAGRNIKAIDQTSVHKICSGQVILGTPQGLMTVTGQADFPPGSRVEIVILPQSARNTGGKTTSPAPAPLAHLARHWETLDEAIRLLETATKKSGLYSVEWDGRNDRRQPVEAGTYTVQLVANGKRDSIDVYITR